MQRYFVTSSGTALGKTLVTAALGSQWRAQGRRVRLLKPVVSGVDWEEGASLRASDPGVLASAMGLEPSLAICGGLSPFRFRAPLAPAMAAVQEGGGVDMARLVDFCRQAESEAPEVLLVEGVGGVMAPLTPHHTVLDWMQPLGYEVIMVVGSYLGALSHALTACRVVESTGLKIALVIVNEQGGASVGMEPICGMLRAFVRAPVVALPAIADTVAPWRHAPDLCRYLEG